MNALLFLCLSSAVFGKMPHLPTKVQTTYNGHNRQELLARFVSPQDNTDNLTSSIMSEEYERPEIMTTTSIFHCPADTGSCINLGREVSILLY